MWGWDSDAEDGWGRGGWMDGWMDGWRDGGMEGWRDGGMEGWRDGRMDGALGTRTDQYILEEWCSWIHACIQHMVTFLDTR